MRSLLIRSALFTVVAIAHWRLSAPCDDAYIHLRIARNLADAGQPYFNLDHPHMSSSSPAWTILLAGFMALFGSADVESLRFFNLAVCLGGAVIWGRLLARLSGRPGAALIGEMSFLGINAGSSISLMETPLALAIAGAAALRLLAGRPGGYALLSFGIFVRPELSMYLAVAIAARVASRAERSGRVIAEVLFGALPLAVYSLWFFGGIVPQTMLAKALVYDVSPAELVHLVFRNLLGEGAVKGGSAAVMIYCVAIVFSLLWLLFAKPTREALLRPEAIACGVLALAGGAVLGGYAVRHVMLFPWYVPIFALPISIGLAGLAIRLRIAPLSLLAGLALLPALLGIRNLAISSIDDSLWPDFAAAARVRTYLSIGKELATRFPDARLLSSEIGGLGWGFRGEVLDAAGLAYPEALMYHPLRVPDERPSGMLSVIPLALVRDARPELLVSMEVFLRGFEDTVESELYVLERHPVFLSEDAGKLEQRSLWHSEHVNVWIRRDVLSEEAIAGR